jgi:hypothetical protein
MSVTGAVLLDIVERRQKGAVEYGTELVAFNGRDALLDAYEEAIDLVLYLKQALIEREDGVTERVPSAVGAECNRLSPPPKNGPGCGCPPSACALDIEPSAVGASQPEPPEAREVRKALVYAHEHYFGGVIWERICLDALAALVVLVGRLEQDETALQRIEENALAWHGPPQDRGQDRALAVIATWAREALGVLRGADTQPEDFGGGKSRRSRGAA